MGFDPSRHHRRSIRLRGYDYRRPGAYFVTICTQDRACLFGNIEAGRMHPSEAGRMVERWWHALPGKFPNVQTDAFVVMPNHIHGIIIIITSPHARNPGDPNPGDPNPGDPNPGDPNPGDPNPGDPASQPAPPSVRADPSVRPYALPPHDAAPNTRPGRDAPMGASLPAIIQWYKTMTTNEYIRRVKQSGWPPFRGRLWQRNYYERIVWDAEALARIRAYIHRNPARWPRDRNRS